MSSVLSEMERWGWGLGSGEMELRDIRGYFGSDEFRLGSFVVFFRSMFSFHF